MSKLDQMRARKPSVIFTSRADARYLAVLNLFWRDQNITPSSMSELIRLSLESFAEFLVTSGKVEFVSTLGDALEILENSGLSPQKKNSKYIAQQLAKESLNAELLATAPSISPSHDTRVKTSPLAENGPEIELAKTLLNKALDEDLEREIEEQKKELKDKLIK